MARVRKAVVAGLGAGVTAAVASIVQSGVMTQDEIMKAIGVGIAAAAATAWATYTVRNAKA